MPNDVQRPESWRINGLADKRGGTQAAGLWDKVYAVARQTHMDARF